MPRRALRSRRRAPAAARRRPASARSPASRPRSARPSWLRSPASATPPRRGRERAGEIVEDGLEDVVGVCGQKGVRQQPGGALVDGRRAHLDRRRGPDRVADGARVDARSGQGGDLARPRAGEVDARRGVRAGAARPRSSRRRPRARSPPAGRRPPHGRRRGRVQVGDERSGAGAARQRRRRPPRQRARARAARSRGRCRPRRQPRPGPARSSSPAAVASRRVRSLRPASVVTTRAPPAAYAAPTALPIAPAPTRPIVDVPTSRTISPRSPDTLFARARSSVDRAADF